MLVYNHPPGTSHRVLGLDLVRYVAIMTVMIYHASYFFTWMLPKPNPLLLGGWLGVDLFFVLSGFLIGGILLRSAQGEFGFRQVKIFWKRRWYRTLPNYYLFLTINIFLVFVFGIPFEPQKVPDLPRYFFFTQNLFRNAGEFFNESWSLCVEEWFYLLFPLVMMAGGALIRQKRALHLFCIVILVSMPIYFRWAYGDQLSWYKDVRKAVWFRFDSLGFGGLAAYLQFYFPATIQRYKRFLVPIGAVFLFFAVVFYFQWDSRGAPARILLFPLFAVGAMGMVLRAQFWRGGSTWIERMISAGSVHSYSMYLLNLPLFFVMERVLGNFYRGHWGWSISLASLWIVLVHLGSALIYRFYEHPLTELRPRGII